MKRNEEIDKRFADALRQWESAPSDRAWNALENRLHQKKSKRKAIWWTACTAAASVVLMLGSVWVVTHSDGTPTPPVAVTPPPVRVVPDTTPKSTPSAPQLPEVVPPSGTNARNAETPARSTDVAPERTPLTKRAAKQLRQPESAAPLSAPAIARLDLPETPAPETKLSVDVPAAPTPDESTLVVVVLLPDEAAEAHPETDSPDAPKKEKGFLRVLKKLKHAEFDELGIRRDNIFAFAREKSSKADK